MKDDLDLEEKARGKKGKDAIASAAIRQALAIPVLMDTAKNSLLSKDHKVSEQLKKSLKNWPDSVFENDVEGIDVVNSHGPEFASNNPSSAAAIGMVLDILDPISYGVTKAAVKAKIPATLAQGVMKYGDKIADSGTEKYVKKLIDKRERTSVGNLVDYIKKNDLRGKLREPEELVKSIEGTFDNQGKKATEGTIDKVGQDIVRTTRIADQRGAKPINRREIYDKMKRSVIAKNATDTESGVVPVDAYARHLEETIKPFEKKTSIIEGPKPKKPETMPAIPSEDLETKIANLSKEADTIKKSKAVQAAQKAEREKAEAALKKAPAENPKAEVDSKKAAQRKEREAAEKATAKENESIKAENDKSDKAILDLLMKKRAAEAPIDPMDKIPAPKSVKGLPDYPAKEVLDIKLHNKKADQVNRRYIDTQELKEELPSIEEQIAQLSSMERKPLKEVEVPPEMPDEAFGDIVPPIPREVDVPPAIPDAAIGRDLESVLAELSDAQAAKKNLGSANAKISKENTDAMRLFGLESKAAGPRVLKEKVDRISSLENMWSLKKSIRERLSTTDWNRVENLPVNKEQLVEASKEVDDRIIQSLKEMEFSEGNAADIYRELNREYGDQADLLEIAVKDMFNKWRGGGRKGGALPALAGGSAAALMAKMTGGNVPLSTVAGSVAGEGTKRGFMSTMPEVQASIGDRLSKPETAHIATQAGMEVAEIPAQYERQNTSRELEDQKPAKGQDMSVDDEDMSPEVKAFLEGGRAPQSEEEVPQGDPIDQKMTHVLMPEKPTWDPYINEAVLNTFLPRDSKRILENPTALMAKMQQVAPNQVPVIQEMLDNDPESLVEAAPKLAMMFPALFEKDKYGMFDGKITDPMMQQKFLTDLAEDEDMDSIEKANLAMKVQRGESIHS